MEPRGYWLDWYWTWRDLGHAFLDALFICDDVVPKTFGFGRYVLLRTYLVLYW